MRISKMKAIFELAHLSNDTVRLIGKHGIGKSQIVEEFAKEKNYHIETLFLSQNEVADLIGIPVQENGITYWSKPIWLHRMEEANKNGKHCVLFLDELSRAPLEVRQASLQLVLEGRIHEHYLPVKDGLKTLIIAADNPTEDYDVFELDPALLDRFANFEVDIDVKDWIKWAKNNNVLPVVTDYIAEFPDKLHFIPEDDSDKGATPRSWKKLSDILHNVENVDDMDSLLYSVICSKLGQTVGSSFHHFYRNYIHVVKPEDLFKILKDEKFENPEDFEKAAEKIKDKVQNMEALSIQELADKIKDKIKNLEGKEDSKSDKSKKAKTMWENILTAFLTAINVEVMVSIIKGWKEGDDSEFYFTWAETVPNGFIFKRVLEIKKNEE